MSGGGARPVIPFLKRIGFLGSDGVPTDRYKRFRNPSQSGHAAREALKEGYKAIYEVNEYAHDASDEDLLGIIVQITGLEPSSSTTRSIVASFKALKEYAVFSDLEEEEVDGGENDSEEEETPETPGKRQTHLGLTYTINLNLPATSDIKVFDAIFRSLKEHILK